MRSAAGPKNTQEANKRFSVSLSAKGRGLGIQTLSVQTNSYFNTDGECLIFSFRGDTLRHDETVRSSKLFCLDRCFIHREAPFQDTVKNLV